MNVANHKKGFTDRFTTDRAGPEHMWQLSAAAQRRFRTPAEKLDGARYRPRSLSRLNALLEQLPPWSFDPPTDLLATEVVKIDDTLGGYALRHYHKVDLYPRIYEANVDTLDDADDIFPGQEIRIPHLPATVASENAAGTTDMANGAGQERGLSNSP